MCGRFTLRAKLTELARQFGFEVGELRAWQARYNLAPTQGVLAVRRFEDESRPGAAVLSWGLIPSWAKSPDVAHTMINARSETLAEKPAFRSAFRERRCLILADGFYEWQKSGKSKQPFFIRLRDERPFAFAGLWERWHNPLAPPNSPATETCTIITTAANDLTRPLHERMPVILDEPAWANWLDPRQHDVKALQELLQTYPAERMQLSPVSAIVNSPRVDSPECLDPPAMRQGELF